jgi:hypothetical protein
MLMTTIVSLVFALPIRTCAPPPNMCPALEVACNESGLSPSRCAELSTFVCPGNRCLACDRAVTECVAGDLDCQKLDAFCDASLQGCACKTSCSPTHELTLPALFAVCWAFPWALQDECATPSVGQCFAVLGWDGCDIKTCDYLACAEDLAELGEICPAELPASCQSSLACGLAEEG